MTGLINGTPQSYVLGINDQSIPVPVLEPEQLPTHLPKVYIYAKQGPTTPQLVVGNSRLNMYGADSFDLRLPWATHATVLANLLDAKANACMYQRVQPDDAGPLASIRLSLDVLATNVPQYERNPDGSLKVDNNNAPIPVTGGAVVAGFKVKWVTEVVGIDTSVGGTGESTWGVAPQTAGTQTDAVTLTQSKKYPIFEIQAPYFGAAGNLKGFRLWAPTSQSSIPIDPTLLTDNMIYPLRAAFVSKASADATPTIVQTMAGEGNVDLCFVPNTINMTLNTQAFVGDVLVQAYQNLDTPGQPPQYGPFGSIHVYQDNLNTLLAGFYAAEAPFIDGSGDFTGAVGEVNRFNFVGGTDSNAIPYNSYIFAKDSDAVRLADSSTIYALGGSDGTMNETLFANLVSTEVVGYADPNSILQDTAMYPESIIYDSGFPLKTKYDLMSIIGVRKDTAVALCVHDVLGPVLTASEESALAVALRTRLSMYPESAQFGTPVVRGIVVGRSGTLIGSAYTRPLPVLLEIASKAAAYMGAGNGRWKTGQSFDKAPLSQITMFRDINVTFTPSSVRNTDWANGLNWVQSFDRSSFFFPALKTAYDNDASVLTSFFTMMGCVEVEKVGDRCWRAFTGSDSLTNAQIIKQVTAFMNDNLNGRFDSRFTIVPTVFFTPADIARGYSYSIEVEFYAANMKTAQTMSIAARRIEDLTT